MGEQLELDNQAEVFFHFLLHSTQGLAGQDSAKVCYRDTLGFPAVNTWWPPFAWQLLKMGSGHLSLQLMIQ